GKVRGLHEGLSFACWFRNRQCLGGVGLRMSIAAGGEQCGGTKCCRGAHERTTGWSGNVSHAPILAEISVSALRAKRPCQEDAACGEFDRRAAVCMRSP